MAVLTEAKKRGCNLIVAHHPVIFQGLKRLTGKTLQERLIFQAIQDNIALYAMHTNLDNVLAGVNGHAAELLGLRACRVLRPRVGSLSKLAVLLPTAAYAPIRKALHAAGAGTLGEYAECSFRTAGIGTFLPKAHATPYIGTPDKLEEVEELRLEVIFPTHKAQVVCAALKKAHPYEEPAYYLTTLKNTNKEVGAGVLGELPNSLSAATFLKHVSKVFNARCIRHTSGAERIKKVAFCGGAGGFLLTDAAQAGADAFVTSELKYHDFFDASAVPMLCDIGHAESEEHVKTFIYTRMKKKFPNIAIHMATFSTNPISYHILHGE